MKHQETADPTEPVRRTPEPLTQERLEEIRFEADSTQRYFNPWPNAVRELLAEVDRLRAEAAKWIPVTEIRPADEHELVVAFSVHRALYFARFWSGSGDWSNNASGDTISRVTHWMKIPELPGTDPEKKDPRP